MQKKLRLPKARPALRMLKRLIRHSKSWGEIQELWELSLELLDSDERRSWLIAILTEYQYDQKSINEKYKKLQIT